MAFGSIASVSFIALGCLSVAVIAIAYAITIHRRLRTTARAMEQAVAARQQAECEIERVRGDLEDRVRQRTQALELRNE
jgi:hypothetical protein